MRKLSFAFCLAPLLSPFLARADDEPQRRAQAEIRFREGLELHTAGKERDARIRFEEAYAILGDNPNILMNLAREEQLTGDEALAARHYRTCLKSEKLNEKARGLAEKFLAELQQSLAQLEVLAPNGTTLWVDGKPAPGPFEETLYVKPGTHSLVARLGANEQRTDDVKATPAAVTAVRFFDGMHVVTGVGLAQTAAPPESPLLEPTSPSPPTSSDGPDATGRRLWTPARLAGTGLAALAVTSLGVGIGFGVDANAKHSDWVNASGDTASNTACTGVESPRCSSLANLQSTQRNDAAWSTAGFIGAGAFAAGAAVLWLLPPPKERPKDTSISFSAAPSLGRGTAGLVAVGRF